MKKNLFVKKEEIYLYICLLLKVFMYSENQETIVIFNDSCDDLISIVSIVSRPAWDRCGAQLGAQRRGLRGPAGVYSVRRACAQREYNIRTYVLVSSIIIHRNHRKWWIKSSQLP